MSKLKLTYQKARELPPRHLPLLESLLSKFDVANVITAIANDEGAGVAGLGVRVTNDLHGAGIVAAGADEAVCRRCLA